MRSSHLKKKRAKKPTQMYTKGSLRSVQKEAKYTKDVSHVTNPKAEKLANTKTKQERLLTREESKLRNGLAQDPRECIK